MGNRIANKVLVRVLCLVAVVMALGSWFMVGRQSASLEEQLLARGRMEAILGAKIYGKVLEEAIDAGLLTVKDVFDTEYQVIPGFEPAKYHTKYDTYLDKAILSVEDEILKDDSVVYAVGVDINGYLPTHNTRYQQPITGDKAKDLVGNRTKRIFADPVGIKSAKNTEEGFLQVYNRDTGETMWDISSPITVKGKFWGNFRLGYSLVKINNAKQSLVFSLVGIMALILAVSAIAIAFSVNALMKPLTELTRAAGELADGQIDREIKSVTNDEIGQMADVVERLRVSLKAAMERLTRGR